MWREWMAKLEVINYVFELNPLIIIIGSFLGSIKTSSIINNEGSYKDKLLDICLGMFCGVMAGHNFSNELNGYLTGLIALLGGISGAIIIEVVIELLPKATKQIITNYLKVHKK